MNLYRSKGSIWTGTQADAKAANDGDKGFESIEVPTDKPGLLAFLNTFPVKVGGEELAPPVPVVGDWQENVPVGDPDVEDRDAHLSPAVRKAQQPPTKPGDCPACNRSARLAKQSNGSSAFISIRADIEDIDDEATIDRIIHLAQQRRGMIVEAS